MKTIRHNVFETNSSSTHSISISKDCDGVLETLPVNDDGIVILNGGEFGWEEDSFSDPQTKASYVFIDSMSSPQRIKMLKEVIMEHTGAKDVVMPVENIQDSYIDHQSIGTTEKIQTKSDMKMFIFNPKSILYTDNDNH
jgi:hypothetical protein